MHKQTLALALCRVSSIEQLENNSLNRQREAVLKAANELGVTIPDDGWWSGSVSSKRGTNVARKDLNEMIERCKRDKRIKLVIVDEPDRFMRSIDEAAFFEVTFRQLGVKVWYASDPELNKGDLASKLLKFTKYLSAEGSNEERQRKSIAGQETALREGRYPFAPKPGYRRGYERGIQEIDTVRGHALKAVLKRIATRQVTPSEGLVELNNSPFMAGHSHYRMDKFRVIVTDPFYAGVVEVDKQVKVRNENGLHEPLITRAEHLELVKIMNDKRKVQSGPRKNGNPKYPLNNIVGCTVCVSAKNGKLVGFDHSNGRKNGPIYEKYRCRVCGNYWTRELLHSNIERLFRENPITDEGVEDLMEALQIVWNKEEERSEQETTRIKHKVASLRQSIKQQVEAVTDPSNAAIKDEILAAIEARKKDIVEAEEQLDQMQIASDKEKEQFLKFAFDFIGRMGTEFLSIPYEDRIRCKQVVFPGGLHVDAMGKVYTTEMSSLYRLAIKKKDTEVSKDSLVVRVKGL